MRWLLALLAAGCVGNAGFPCTRDAECAPGRCEPSASACSFADTSCPSGWRFGEHVAGPAGECVAAPAECGKTLMFTDAFDTPDRHPFWSTSSTATTVAQTGGRLVFTIAANTAGSSFAHYVSRVAFDLTGSRIFVEVPVTPNPLVHGQGYLQIFADSANSLRVLVQDGMLTVTREVAGVTSTLISIAHDPAAHRFWQLREQGGTVFVETSRDGLGWDPPLTQTTDLFDLTSVKVQLSAGISAAEADPGQVAFDGYNGGLPATIGACPIAQLDDDFADGTRASAWLGAYTVNGCVMEETGGEVVMTPAAATTNSYCAYQGGAAYDFTNGAASVEVADVGTVASIAETYLSILDLASGDLLRVVQQNGTLHCQRRTGGNFMTVAAVDPYDPIAHRFWRLRHDGAQFFCEAGGDGITYGFSQPFPDGLPPGALRVEIGAGTYIGVPAPGTMRIAAFNQ